MAAIQDKVCRNHPDRPATERCDNCFKPLCEDCVLIRDGKPFCSERCFENQLEVSRNISSFETRRKREVLLRRRRRLVRATLMILLLGAVLAYILTHQSQVLLWRDWLLDRLPDLAL
ncbi:MAG: hypothetical protein K9N51_01035 [Candidatus Pacebacteria bacterium]|nr:hypothetical protein [Candidatus Paceibacterota bacterium]